MAGPATFVLLSTLAAAAGLCVAAWLFDDGERSDRALCTCIAATAVIAIPVHALGWLELLTRGALLGSILALELAIVLPTAVFARRRLMRAIRDVGSFAYEGIARPLRESSLAAVGLGAVLALAAWTAWLAYLAPSSAWDGVMYHEPMIGFALQNEGFAWVGLEGANAMLGPVDGYPRLSENLMLALAVMWDRRLIDVLPSAMIVILIVALYVLFRRWIRSPTAALGWACGFALLPGVFLQLRSTFVDVTFAAFVAASAAFVVRSDPRPRDLWIAGLSLGLLGSSKVTGLIVVPLIGLIGLLLAVRAARRRPLLLAHLAGGFVLVLALMGPTYARNWTVAHNLTWPSAVAIAPLGIDWPGPIAITNMNVPNERALRWFFGPPIPNEQFHDTKDNGYGNVPPFLVPPLAAIGLLAALRRAILGPDRERAIVLLALSLPLIATFAMTPARHWTRLNFHTVIAVFALAAYVVGPRRRRWLAEGSIGALVLGGLMTLHWSEPAWDVDWDRQARLARLDAQQRAAQRDGIFTLMPTATALARERELGPGSRLVFSEHPFVGLLWNERFDNRVERIDPRRFTGEAWLREAERRRATWAVVPFGSHLGSLLAQSDRWQEVGPADGTDRPALAFRRVD